MINDDPLIYMIDRKGKIVESELITDTKSSKSVLSSSLNIDSLEKQRVDGNSRRYSNNDSIKSSRSTANRAIQTDSSLSIQSLNSSSSTSTRRSSSNKTQQQNDSQISLNNITLLKY